MSAYIVTKSHILYLIAAAQALPNMPHSHAYRDASNAQLAELANILLDACVRSVSYRYPNLEDCDLPGAPDRLVTEEDVANTKFGPIDPIQALKSADCYEYQSCEHPEWKQSQAASFYKAFEDCVTDDEKKWQAAIWGAPEPLA